MALENHPARSPPPRWSRLLPLYGDLRGLDRGALAQDLLAGAFSPGDVIRVEAEGDRLVFQS